MLLETNIKRLIMTSVCLVNNPAPLVNPDRYVIRTSLMIFSETAKKYIKVTNTYQSIQHEQSVLESNIKNVVFWAQLKIVNHCKKQVFMSTALFDELRKRGADVISKEAAKTTTVSQCTEEVMRKLLNVYIQNKISEANLESKAIFIATAISKEKHASQEMIPETQTVKDSTCCVIL